MAPNIFNEGIRVLLCCRWESHSTRSVEVERSGQPQEASLQPSIAVQLRWRTEGAKGSVGEIYIESYEKVFTSSVMKQEYLQI